MKKVILVAFLFVGIASAQTHLYLMMGSSFSRGSNIYSVAVGQNLNSMDTNLLGNELTFSYSYEKDRSHGIFCGKGLSQTESIGMMQKFSIKKMRMTMYSWPLMGVTSIATDHSVTHHFFLGAAFGTMFRLSDHNSLIVQELMAVTPMYTTVSIGYGRSW
jgi:hypothetical protein